jgi:hypothetical protein
MDKLDGDRAGDLDQIRVLSDSVLEVAHAGLKGEITSEGWQTLIAAGLTLRKLAGLPPPWADGEKGVP